MGFGIVPNLHVRCDNGEFFLLIAYLGKNKWLAINHEQQKITLAGEHFRFVQQEDDEPTIDNV